MKPFYIYISLVFFIACIAAPSVVALSDFKIKETKVAKVFEMEEEDHRDKDSESKGKSTEKFFEGTLNSLSFYSLKVIQLHYCSFQLDLLDWIREKVTPPPQV